MLKLPQISASVGPTLATMMLLGPGLQAQIVHMQPTHIIGGNKTADFYTLAFNDAVNSCESPYEVSEGTENTTLTISGVQTYGLYSFCRLNLTANSYAIYENLYVWQRPSGPPMTSPKCVGSCVQPNPTSVSMPLPPPFPLPPLPCVIDDVNLCTTGSSANAANEEGEEEEGEISVLSLGPLTR